MLLKDIAIGHTKKARKGNESDQDFIMHPFENSIGAYAGKYEVLRNVNSPGEKPVKRSAHVTMHELAELYAHGLLEMYQMRLRLRAANDNYPTAPPGKKVPAHCIVPGSEFDKMVTRILQSKQPISAGLARELVKLNIGK